MRIPDASGYSEDLRQLEHLVPIGFAFLVRYLTWPQTLLLASVAVIYGLLSSHLWSLTRRPEETGKRFSGGKLAYAVAVFCLVLFFPDRKFIVVAVWANLSVGDAVSNLAGRNFGRAVLPWNRRKTWIGMSAAFVASTVAAWLLIAWTGMPEGNGTRALCYALATAAVCSLVETLPLPVDDNLTICASGALFLAWLTQAAIPGSFAGSRFTVAFAASFLTGVLALLVRGVTAGGCAAGVLIGTAAFYAFGAGGFALLGLFFVLGTAFTRLGYGRKKRMGAAEPHGAQRSAAHVWGKGIAAFLAAICAVFARDSSLAAAAFVAAVAAALYDTTATELGLLAGGRTFLLNTLLAVPRGTRGAVSMAGSLLGLLGAGAVAVPAYLFGLVNIPGIFLVLAAATIASHLESWAAARPQGSCVSGPMMNAFHTVTAMLLVAVLGGTFGV